MSLQAQDFDELVFRIESAYVELGHTRGWRFLCGPRATLETSPDIALITANPGGTHHTDGHGIESCESGSAYLTEAWGTTPGNHNLQRQILALFQLIAEHMVDEVSGEASLNTSLTAYYIPFRSPRLSELQSAKQSVKFAEDLWTTIFSKHVPKLIVTIDHAAFRGVSAAIERHSGKSMGDTKYPTGWGNVSAAKRAYRLPSGKLATVLRLPHLSTFKLFSRPQCAANLDLIVRESAADL